MAAQYITISVFRVLVQFIYLCIDIATLNTMVFACGVPECNTGYRSSQAIEKVAVFKFPKMINFVRSR